VKRKLPFPKPDIFLEKVDLRHTENNQKLLRKLERSMRTEGWNGRPLLVLCAQRTNGDNVYETVTGCHRARAAMNVGVKIPCVRIPKARFRTANLKDYSSLASLLQKAGLRKAAKLARLEVELGSTGQRIKPPKRPGAGSKKFRLRRVVQNK
jgi:hypothetical protein